MWKTLSLAAAAMAVACAVPAFAASPADGPTLIQSKGCLACHATDQMKVGPAFAWVAERFHARKDAVDYLAEKVIKGSDSDWAAWTYATPMPPHPDLSPAQAKDMAAWVMAQKPIKAPNP